MENATEPSGDKDATVGRPKPSRSAAKSAAPLGSGSSRRDRPRRGRTASATTHRMTLSPAVCGVGPGRLLELCANLDEISSSSRGTGLRSSHDSHMTQQRQLSISLPSGGFLRSARLHPLGIVDTLLIRPDECLGIISTSSRRDDWTRREGEGRPRSSTAEARITLDLQTQERRNEEKEHVKKKRSLSAIGLHRSPHVLHKSQSVVLPRNTALVPTHSPLSSAGESKHCSSEQQTPVLPLVMQQETKNEVRVEVRSCKKPDQSSPILSNEGTGSNVSIKLPHISALPLESERSTAVDDNKLTLDDGRDIPKRLSVVSLGETTTCVQDRPQRLNTRKKHRSPDGREGKLSLGWSSTKTVKPIRGQSVYQPDRSITGDSSILMKKKSKSTQANAGLNSAGEAVVSRDCIQIDVQEYLANV